MENKTPQNKHTTSASASSSPARAASARPRASSAGAQTGHRPSGFAPAAPQKRKTVEKPAPAKAPKMPKREKQVNNKRTQARSSLALWQKILLIGVPALILLIVIIVLIFGGSGGTYHQLPKIERTGSSVFGSDETDAPAATDAPEQTTIFGNPSAFENFADEERLPDGLEGFGEAGDMGGLEGAENLDGADLTEQLPAEETGA